MFDQKIYNNTPERKAFMKAYATRPEQKEKRKAYKASAKYREYWSAYRSTPEYKVYMAEYHQRYYSTSNGKTKSKANGAKPGRKEYMKSYWASPEGRAKRCHLQNQRRLSKTANGGSHTMVEWLELCGMFADCCAYCGMLKKLTRDHDVPVSRGGTDDISNILPSCSSCNSSKHDRTAAEFELQRAIP